MIDILDSTITTITGCAVLDMDTTSEIIEYPQCAYSGTKLTLTKLLKRADDHLVFKVHLDQTNSAADPATNDVKVYVYYNYGSVAPDDHMLYLQKTTGVGTSFPALQPA